MFRFNFMSVFIALTTFIMFQVSSVTYAVTIKSEPTAEQFEDAAILKSARLEMSDKEKFDLAYVSHGLRKKAVFGLVPVRVYVIQLLAAQPGKLVKNEDEFLKSLKTAGPVQLHITFLRDLPGSKISEAFKEGLESNKVNVKHLNPEMEQVLKEISGMNEFKKGESFSVSVYWKDKLATIYLQDPKGEIKTITGPEEFAEQFLSIWFGKPSDGKLKDLKKALIK
jgi:Chalcone isomerase-like